MSDSERVMSDEDEEQYQSEGSSMEEENVGNEFMPGQKLTIQKEDNDPRCATYVFQNEDHTLGNVLRVVLAGHPDVEFVGYTIPHPSDNKMNLRLQTSTKKSNDVLQEGFNNVQMISKTIREEFTKALKKYK